MKVNNQHYRTIYFDNGKVRTINQNALPFEFKWFISNSYKETCKAIQTMIVRGAGAIGAAAGYAMAQAACEAPADNYYHFLEIARYNIENTRPTARNLFFSTEKVFNEALKGKLYAIAEAERLADENSEEGRLIGEYGNNLIKDRMNIETHCNAGWLAFVDYGSALAPIYNAWDKDKKIFVYVDETRPRLQGGRLTAWELFNQGIPHAILPDNAGASLMAQGKIDMIIVGADRIAANGDVANKIGTLEKAITANYYNIPFYVAAPCSTIDFNTKTGKDIIIEQRDADEVKSLNGIDQKGNLHTVTVNNPLSDCINPAFDITPAKLITSIITNKGIVDPNENSIISLFQ
jgi:S-methyl-5-thioribose-1-phosphate isomerase